MKKLSDNYIIIFSSIYNSYHDFEIILLFNNCTCNRHDNHVFVSVNRCQSIISCYIVISG